MPHNLIQHLAETWEVVAFGLAGGREAFEALTPTWRSLLVIAAAVALGFVIQTAWSTQRGLPSQVQTLDYRIDSLGARLDTLDMDGLRRTEGTREMIREVHVQLRETRRALDDLSCVLRAQARSEDPVIACREPLPEVPWPRRLQPGGG